ncbi:tRNA preQ1(34) S-adenosylmethionine ribosyltransferase-isomerase QueA [Candidatus Uhrbacteria bacterium]|nr:tRNA preQ1(34) S-adenosylmethionine ribosyltransferase-isomerase QueA [Candidatus Uhrbacteria bacterium]
MRTDAFIYTLPARAIAEPPARRDRSRLLAVDRTSGRCADHTIRDLPDLLRFGDLVVVNDTKVFRARLAATVDGKSVELLLVRPEEDAWIVLARPGRRLRPGRTLMVGAMHGTVRAAAADGSYRVAFDRSPARVIAYANRMGSIPTPPYVRGSVRRLAEYQTTYARHVGSVAAPTAGFHCTPQLLRMLRSRGIRIARVTLHVGLGTFQPIRAKRLEEHDMHAEWVHLSERTVRAITQTHATGHRVVAIGTTTLRALEGVMDAEGALRPFRGFINIFITPGFRFRVVDALLTNFHLPQSTLLVLVAAFAAPGRRGFRGRDLVLRAYRRALRQGYRFYSFGDAMLLQ